MENKNDKRDRLNQITETIIGAAMEVHHRMLKNGIRRLVNDF